MVETDCPARWNPLENRLRSAQQVRQQLFALLQEIQIAHTPDPFLRQHLQQHPENHSPLCPGLLHLTISLICPAPITIGKANFAIAIAAYFAPPAKKVFSRRILQRTGAWELIPRRARFRPLFKLSEI